MYPKLRLVYKESKGIECCLEAVVVKTESLKIKYPGGLRHFTEKCIAQCNRDIAVICAIDDDEIVVCIEELLEHGLLPKKDFIRLDAFSEVLLSERKKGQQAVGICGPELGVDWLKGSIHGHSVLLEYQR